MKKEVFFLLDFGGKFGYGHLSRCTNLAESFLKEKYKINLLLSDHSIEYKGNVFVKKWIDIYRPNIYIIKNIFSKRKIEIKSVSEEINNIVKDNILIIDHYYLSQELFNQVKKPFSIIQLKDNIYDMDLVKVDNNRNKIVYFLPKELLSRDLIENPNIFCGIDLVPTFPSKIKLSYPAEFSSSNLNILFTPGSAENDLTNSIAERIKKFSSLGNIKFYCPNHQIRTNKNLNKINGDRGLLNYIYFSSLVITAAGNTMLESLKLEIPTISYCTNRNQLALAEYFNNINKTYLIENSDFINFKNISRISRQSVPLKTKLFTKKTNYKKLIMIINDL